MWQNANLPAKLFVITYDSALTYSLDNKLSLGRSTASISVDISLTPTFVSRSHGLFDRDETGWFYIDVGSKNGTFHNNIKINPHTKRYLHNGDIIKIERTANPIPEEIIRIIFSTDYPLEYTWQSLNNLEDASEISIGRGSGNNLGLADKAISINHASFYQAENRWHVADYNSTNGVYLNSCHMRYPMTLQLGDCIKIANLHFIFMGNNFVYQQIKTTPKSPKNAHMPNSGSALQIQIVERSVWQRAKKLMLLQDINMTINSGELVLILGGSGAGKTTFMNAVMGYEKAEGHIVHGDTDIYKNFKSIKHKIGFVPQLDLLRGNDSVYDTLANAAEMKLSTTINERDRYLRIEKVLDTLGLTRERNSLVSKLSGGQRKRLSIAVEYIADPSLFFLDEPDSGLDGIMSRTLMQNLRTIADEGKIVMVISHAPDRVAKLFDKIIVLAKSTKDNCGHLAFFGSVSEGLEFFEIDCLEGIVQRINRPDEGGDGLSDYYINKYKHLVGGD